jgi:hypothetical protein
MMFSEGKQYKFSGNRSEENISDFIEGDYLSKFILIKESQNPTEIFLEYNFWRNF